MFVSLSSVSFFRFASFLVRFVSFRFVSFHFVSFRFVSFRFVFVLFRFVSFRFVFVLFRFVLFRFVSFRFVSFRFVSFRFYDVQGGQWRKALVLLQEMEVLDCLPPNMHCMNSAIDACGKV